MQDDWESFITEIENADLNSKTIALFGLGDGITHSDNFVDDMGLIYEVIKQQKCKIVGDVDAEGYDFDNSISVVDNSFIGFAIDEDW